jgi:hypothetical protein
METMSYRFLLFLYAFFSTLSVAMDRSAEENKSQSLLNNRSKGALAGSSSFYKKFQFSQYTASEEMFFNPQTDSQEYGQKNQMASDSSNVCHTSDNQTNTQERYLKIQDDSDFTNLELTPAPKKPGRCRIFLEKSKNWFVSKAQSFKTPLLVVTGVGLTYIGFLLAFPEFKASIQRGVEKAFFNSVTHCILTETDHFLCHPTP